MRSMTVSVHPAARRFRDTLDCQGSRVTTPVGNCKPTLHVAVETRLELAFVRATWTRSDPAVVPHTFLRDGPFGKHPGVALTIGSEILEFDDEFGGLVDVHPAG